MRNKVQLSVFLVLIIFSGCESVNAQLLGNKLNVFAGYESGGFSGAKAVSEGKFKYPSLYPGYGSLNGVNLKIQYNIKNHFTIGITLAQLFASKWENPDSMLYQDSKIKMSVLSVDLLIHTKLADAGLWNRLRLSAGIAPSVGLSKLTLLHPLYNIQQNGTAVASPAEISDMFYGMALRAGAEFSLTQQIGLAVDYSYGYYFVSSIVYNDKNIRMTLIDAGITLKLLTNKHILY
jgi:opacity protein-like surface antigen